MAPELARVVFMRPAQASDRDDYWVVVDESGRFVGIREREAAEGLAIAYVDATRAHDLGA